MALEAASGPGAVQTTVCTVPLSTCHRHRLRRWQ